jgi:hypothetical protein
VVTFEYKTEVLTSVVGRDKLRMGDLDAVLSRHGDEGWEPVSLTLGADLKGTRDGHLLIFKRQVGGGKRGGSPRGRARGGDRSTRSVRAGLG